MSTLHILSSPSSPVNILNRVDAFSIAVVKFINNMTALGWNCVHYGIPGSDVNCENVICLSSISEDEKINKSNYNKNAGQAIADRKQPGDFILCFYGIDNQEAALMNNDLKIVEPSIGYTTAAVFAPYRVFVSYAQMHMFYGERGMLMSPSWYDAVIPNAFSPEEFEYNENKDDYFLYFGRVIHSKGIDVAIQATQEVGKKLIIAGPGDLRSLNYESIPSHVELVGLCDAHQRRELMKNALAIVGPTYYVEPFGNMIVEGYLSGTPAITTDWGGFTETVIQGVTGYRCREFKEFVDAMKNINQIKSKDCYNWAIQNYHETIVHKKFDNYFKKLELGDFYRT